MVSDADAHRAVQLLRLAFDQSTTAGEQDGAMLGLMRIGRAKQWCIADFISAIRPLVDHMDDEPWGSSVVINFGKHKGRTLGQILSTDPDYLHWCISEFRHLKPALRAAIESVLESVI